MPIMLGRRGGGLTDKLLSSMIHEEDTMQYSASEL